MLSGAGCTPSSEEATQAPPTTRIKTTEESDDFTTSAASCAGEISARETAKPKRRGSPVRPFSLEDRNTQLRGFLVLSLEWERQRLKYDKLRKQHA
jgi:hypothetical protein